LRGDVAPLRQAQGRLSRCALPFGRRAQRTGKGDGIGMAIKRDSSSRLIRETATPIPLWIPVGNCGKTVMAAKRS
jgi:hypothetical protein